MTILYAILLAVAVFGGDVPTNDWGFGETGVAFTEGEAGS